MADENLWDLYPLAADSWGNIWSHSGFDNDGDTLKIIRYDSTEKRLPMLQPIYFSTYWTDPPNNTQASESRECYIPQPKDIEAVNRAFPNIADPYNPPWTEIEAAFVAAGYSLQDLKELRKLKAPVLLQLFVNLSSQDDDEANKAHAIAQTTPTHSEDFTSVNWYGINYTFAKGNQAQTVRALWEAWKNGGHALSQETLREKIKSSAERFEMRKAFRINNIDGKYEQHPAWKVMIQPAGKGCFKLRPPLITLYQRH